MKDYLVSADNIIDMLDENDEFVLQYGKVVEFNDNYILYIYFLFGVG